MEAVLNLPGMFGVYSRYFYRPDDATLREKSAVVGIVVLLHLSVFVLYWFSPEPPMVMVNEMSISFANVQMQQADITPQPKPKPREPDPLPAEEPAKQEEVQPEVQQEATPPSPVQLDAEPDYRADYLNNPKPPYPMVARRMGFHGTVVLDVEVLAEGRAGEVVLHKGCGYDILDKAAIQTVKTWKFLPARRFGQPVTQRFLVPIKFSLEDEA